MPLTDDEKTLIRYETGDDATTFPDAILNLLFDKASTTYADYSRDVWLQAIIVSRYQNLVATYRKDVTYKQNETSENLTDIAKGYAQDLAAAEKKLGALIANEKPVALRTAVMKKVPSRKRSFPNG